MEAWMSLVGEIGFPIAVTFYLLYRIEKKLDQLNQSVLSLGRLLQLSNQMSQKSLTNDEWEQSIFEKEPTYANMEQYPIVISDANTTD